MSSGLSIVPCYVDTIFDDPAFEALCTEAAAEVANPELSPMALDRAFYQRIEQGGSSRCFACYEGVDLAGFAFVLLSPSGFNGQRYATVERLFVSQAARAGGLGLRLMDAVNEAARKDGCEAVFYTAHAGSRLARLLFLCCDKYPLANLVFCRRLN